MAIDATEKRDDALMNMRGGYGGGGGALPGTIFIVPTACKSTHKRSDGDDTKPPGIYLLDHSRGGNDQFSPTWQGRLLTREEALEFAAAFDALAKPHAYDPAARHGDYYPGSWVELVTAWYEALGRRINQAVQKAEGRVSELRETRAALTGRVG